MRLHVQHAEKEFLRSRLQRVGPRLPKASPVSPRQIVPRRGLGVEYCEGTSVHVCHTGFLAATILVHELGGMLQKQNDLSMGVLQ